MQLGAMYFFWGENHNKNRKTINCPSFVSLFTFSFSFCRGHRNESAQSQYIQLGSYKMHTAITVYNLTKNEKELEHRRKKERNKDLPAQLSLK